MRMRETTALILGTVIASIAICAISSAQSSSRSRTPVLTNDDLGSVGREGVAVPVETEVRPSTGREPEGARGQISWQRDIRRAIEVARAEGKLIVADVYTDWCGWCKQMDKTIYSNPAIVALSKQQVFVKVNAEDGGQGQSFAQQSGVTGYPTTIILDGQGRVVQVAEGYIPTPQAFLDLVGRARASQTR